MMETYRTCGCGLVAAREHVNCAGCGCRLPEAGATREPLARHEDGGNEMETTLTQEEYDAIPTDACGKCDGAGGGDLYFESGERYGFVTCPACAGTGKDPLPVLVVTRHPVLVELLVERGLVATRRVCALCATPEAGHPENTCFSGNGLVAVAEVPDVEVLTHATAEDVRGKHVFGVLPLHLAAEAALVTEIPLDLRPEERGVELDLERLREVAGPAVTYRVERIETN